MARRVASFSWSPHGAVYQEETSSSSASALMISRSVNGDMLAALQGMKQYAYDFGPFGTMVEELPLGKWALLSLKFTSVQRLVVRADHGLSVAETASLFQDARVSGLSELSIACDCTDFLRSIILQHAPCLRSIRIDATLRPQSFAALIDAAVASPYLESIRLENPLPPDSWHGWDAHNHRTDDPHASLKVFSSRPRAICKELRRSVPLVSVLGTVVNRSRPETKGTAAESLRLRLHGIDSPPLATTQLVFAPALLAMRTELDSAVEALVTPEDANVLTLPSAFMNGDGELETESRFTNVDIALCVLWLNEYACREVHDMLTQAIEQGEAPLYFLSLQGMAFFTTHICRGHLHTYDNLRRVLSLLSAAHFLSITTLENMLMSLLISPRTRPLLFHCVWGTGEWF